jgi:hypothetical protein
MLCSFAIPFNIKSLRTECFVAFLNSNKTSDWNGIGAPYPSDVALNNPRGLSFVNGIFLLTAIVVASFAVSLFSIDLNREEAWVEAEAEYDGKSNGKSKIVRGQDHKRRTTSVVGALKQLLRLKFACRKVSPVESTSAVTELPDQVASKLVSTEQSAFSTPGPMQRASEHRPMMAPLHQVVEPQLSKPRTISTDVCIKEPDSALQVVSDPSTFFNSVGSLLIDSNDALEL